MDPAPFAPYDRPRLSEVALRVSGRMVQGNEHLPPLTPTLAHMVLDYGVAAIEAVFFSQPLEDALDRVSLLPGKAQVLFKDPVYDAGEELKLGTPGRALPSVSGWHRVGEHLPHSVPVKSKHPGCFPHAHPFHQAGLPHTKIQIHHIHPATLLRVCFDSIGRWEVVQFSTATIVVAQHKCQ